ncbi:MAG: bifunctional phosphopantothenoylcysteine decarboxylase/phosphopantothenate--cysteine ligase CoaBC [Deltaproteobacteria bacterium]|nr:MAG: bifunctional phosphopantothenoylcysteine decarboxylase/phosphopantothenate--cysteine ligase CoaBC [Deltaproteobacteria bacterium]
MALQGRRVLLCVGGGIAAYKACETARLLVKAGAQVRAALTPAAQKFVSPLTFQALTGEHVATDLFSAEQELAAGHIALSDWAELALVAPATANLLARLRLGQADDVAAATLLAIEPRKWLLAPAMNEKMWASAAVQENLRILRERGARVVGPAVGEMAERTHVGPGRLAEPEVIAAAVEVLLGPHDFEGVPVLVTAGPTREAFDPVRFLSNPSSGRMGFALAEAARDRGAQVTLISGPTELPPVSGVKQVGVVSAEELAKAVDEHLDGVRVVVMAAAVADQRPADRAPQKIKKKEGEEVVRLVRTPDILAGLGARPQHPLLVGFAAETENLEENAREKLAKKNLDLIVANDAGAFGQEQSRVVILGKDGARAELSGSKLALAHAVWNMVRERLPR